MRHVGPEDGQAVVELALVIPLLFAILGFIFQSAMIFNVRMAISSAAREGARWASVRKADVPARIKEYIATSLGQQYASGTGYKEPSFEPQNFTDQNAHKGGEPVSVTVEYDLDTVFPVTLSGKGMFSNKVIIKSTSVMRLEDVTP